MPRSTHASQSSLAILLPPSEGKAPGGGRPVWKPTAGLFGRELSRWRRSIALALQECDGGDTALLGVKGSHLEHARAANCALIGSPTMPAWRRYTGVVWDHLDPSTFSPAALDRARNSIAIVSGLLGLVGFDDPIPDYKLKIGATLDLPVTATDHARQTLAGFWQPRVSPVLNEWLSGRTVLDLLPVEHRRVWTPSPDIEVLRATFVDSRGRTVGHDAKAAKGHFVRHVITSRSPIRAVESWSHPDYRIEFSAG